MKKTILVSLIVFASFSSLFSQTIISLSYEPATPIGDMTSFIENTSLGGFSASGSYFLNKKITLGFTAQWTSFYQKEERQTWQIEGGALTANAWKEFYIWNLYANAKYHFLEDARVLPFIGLSLGTAMTQQNAQLGKYEFNETYWKFALAPEVGMMIPMGIERTWGFNVMARYQLNFYNENNIDLLQYINYSFGVYWMIYKRGERY